MDKQQQHPAGQAPAARPHWRRRDPSGAEVYVVHPTQFRSVVQQLTGAAPGHVAANNAAAAAAMATAAQSQRGSGGGTSVDGSRNNNGTGSGRGMTLGEMHQECMAWAAQDDHDQQR